jgi:hypothetical protein
LEKILEKMRCEREIVGENFEKKKEEKTGERNNKKKHGKKIFGEIVGEKKTCEENLGK